jgi:alanyl aminopeptidase
VRTLSFAAAALALLIATSCKEEGPPPAHPAPLPAPAAPPALVPLDDGPPALRLPTEPRPTSEALVLKIDPRQEHAFSGTAEIHLIATRPHRVIWLHARDLNIGSVDVLRDGHAAATATWERLGDTGMGKLTFSETTPPGELTLRIQFEGRFAQGQHGLYRVTEAGTPYAYTQFESTSARYAFPCFDEPSFKIPFTTTLVIPADQTGIANTREVSREVSGGDVRITFAPTPPMPSYLVAFAVGPFDVVPAPDVPPNGVRTRPVPLRAITPKGRAKEVAYALAHTGEILATLEKYFGIEYPYDKLDILAVPGKGGAMENPGAVTFGEPLVLMDEATASVRQRRGYASVMAHELAHQWTGDLVTMQWWDDTWLNEAFATWMAAKAADAWDPKLHLGLSLLRGVQGAMGADAGVSARAVRQPIGNPNDIENAFDTITYQKGAGVLGMFERWAGVDAWRKGLHDHLVAHRFANATADDFLDAENAATGKDVKTAFHTFLDQPGVPLLRASVACAKGADGAGATVTLDQSRFLPLGSTGDDRRTWQIPICVDVASPGGAHPGASRTESCTLLTQAQGSIEIGPPGKCPAWVLPNADAAGYYRFILPPEDLAKLRKNGLGVLTAREKVAYATSLRSAYSRASTPMQDIFDALAPLARDPEPIVAEEPMGYVSQARDWLHDAPLRAKVEAYGAGLYGPAMARLGWDAKKGEDDETRALRGSVVGFLATTARDRRVRAEAKKRGLAYLAALGARADASGVDQNLANVLLAVVGEDADRATWASMEALLSQSVDETLRGRLLWGMSMAKDPDLSRKARDLVTDPMLRETEVLTPLVAQLSQVDTREETWAWLETHYDAILERLPKHRGGTSLVSAARAFCDEAHAERVLGFFAAKIDAVIGGNRVLASTVEDIKLCAARRKVHEPAERAMFGKR